MPPGRYTDFPDPFHAQERPVTINTITPERLAEIHRSVPQLALIDVRTPAEYREVHVAGSQNIPLAQLDPAAVMQAHSSATDERLYVICHSGGRSRQACERFLAAGYANVVNVQGGTEQCVAAGLPVVRGKKTISLERQVRIAAGTLVLLAVTLAALVHPAFIALAALVGAGLVFAGITDTCGMGMLLAKMPWNQSGGPAQACNVR